MTDERELRERLARLDPARHPPAVDLTAGPSAHELMERIMLTEPTHDTDSPAADADPVRTPVWRRPRTLLAAGVAAAAAAAVITVVAVQPGGHAKTGHGTTLTLTLPAAAGGTSINSCIPFDVAVLRDMPVAFAGTVSAVSDTAVTISVDHWYRGGSADTVTLDQPGSGVPVSIDGVDFRTGERYLVTATNGNVNGCGYSGPATPDLERAFADAFGG